MPLQHWLKPSLFLAALDLTLNDHKTRLIDFDQGFEFLGYMFVRSLAIQKAPDPNRRKKTKEIDRPALHTMLNRDNRQKDDNPIDEPQVTREPKTAPKDELEPLSAKEEPAIRHAIGDRILHVVDPDRQIAAKAHSILITTKNGHPVLDLSHRRIDRIEIGPAVTVDQSIYDLCMNNDELHLVFLNNRGEIRGQLIGKDDPRARLQFDQAILADDHEFGRTIASNIVNARIRNQRTQLFRLNRRQQEDEIDTVLGAMARHLRKLRKEKPIAYTRGIEGAAGAEYWKALGHLCLDAERPFKRERPAKTPLNGAINYLTYMLARDVVSAVRKRRSASRFWLSSQTTRSIRRLGL